MNRDRNLSLGLLLLRLGIAGYMITHGWGKVLMVRAGQSAMFGDPIGIGSQLSLWLVMFAEFVCAILVLIGLGTRLAAVPIVITMCPVRQRQAFAEGPPRRPFLRSR